MAEWLSSWLAEQEDRGSIPGGGIHYILKFSLTERCSYPGEDHTNEIKHDIHPE